MKRFITIPWAISFLLCACETTLPDPLTVSPQEIIFYTEGEEQITTNESAAAFSSEDTFYASVDPTGLVTANKVGSTSIIVSGKGETQKIPVIVLSKYSLYPDLDGLIGKPSSDVKSALGSSYVVKENTWLYYDLSSYANLGFTYENGVVANAVVLVPTKYTTMLTKHLIERYTVAGMQNDYYFFLNHDEDVVIGLTVYNISYLAVTYLPYSEATKVSGIMPSFDVTWVEGMWGIKEE